MKQRKSKKTRNPYHNIVPLEAKTDNQKDYIRSIIENDVILCSGPSGSGKSFIAAGVAAHHLYEDLIEHVIITRPLICTGKDIGSLPGELTEKIAPYLLPMQENFKYFLNHSYHRLHHRERKINYKPLEIMRGSTFHNAYMILDEAQNCTQDQIKMFISRMGHNSKVLINGDTDQTDIKRNSGLSICMDKLTDIEGVAICKLNYSDIQRNGIIGKILHALENKKWSM